MAIEKELQDLTKDYIKDIDKIVVELENSMLNSVKELTPYNTGKARNGWILDKDEISNNVPYIGVLEYGSRSRRAYGMVRLTLQKVDKFLKDAINKVNK